MNNLSYYPAIPDLGLESINNQISSLVDTGFKLIQLQGSNLVFRVDIERRKSLVFKLYKDPNSFKREKLALEMLSTGSVKCPKLLDSGIIEDRYHWTLYEYIAGKRLCDFNISTYKNRTDFFYELGRQLAKIHTVSSLNFFSEDEQKTYIDIRLNRFISKSKAYLQTLHPGRPDHSLHFVEAFGFISKYAEQAFTATNFSLVLHDFSPSNIIVSATHDKLYLAGIIDYEFFMFENRYKDFILLLPYLTSDNELEWSFFNGYRSHNNIQVPEKVCINTLIMALHHALESCSVALGCSNGEKRYSSEVARLKIILNICRKLAG